MSQPSFICHHLIVIIVKRAADDSFRAILVASCHILVFAIAIDDETEIVVVLWRFAFIRFFVW